MREIHFNGLVAEEALPRGPEKPHPILFVHGWWCGLWSWRKWMPLFTENGYRCIALTLSGHPTSKRVSDVGQISIYKHIKEARQFARWLGNPILCGHSMGGLIVQKLAEKLDSPAAVVLNSAAPRGIRAVASAEVFTTLFRYTPTVLFSRQFLPPIDEMTELDLYHLPKSERKAVYEEMVPAPGRQARQVAIAGVPVDDSRIRCPFLVVSSTDDIVAPPKTSRAIARKYGADYIECDGNGHFSTFNPGWEHVAGDVLHWLNRQFKSRVALAS